MCTVSLNQELNGVELYFDGKPEQNIIDMLKGAKYRWHRAKKCWYAKKNENTMEVANSIGNNEVSDECVSTIKESKKDFYPNYDKVGGSDIFRESNVSIFDKRGGYFYDVNAYVWFYDGSAVVYDLENALQTGKTCTRYSINQTEWKGNDRWSILNPFQDAGCKNFNDVVMAIKNGNEIDGISVQKSESKAIGVFSPFVKIKPIKIPAKWTKAHVWKAILAGQIFKGEVDGYYTDDYAYDNATNFSTGRPVHLPTLAKDLIESSSDGIRIYPTNERDGVIALSVNNYSFDCKTVWFEENCTHDMAIQRKEDRKSELENYNANLLSQVLNLEESNIEDNSVYIVTYLEMNDNTGRYEKKTEMMYSGRLFYEGECNHQVVEYEKFNPENRTLYALSNFYYRPYGDAYEDKRIIDMDNWQYVVTGYALKELLYEGNRYACIKVADPRTIENARNYLNKHNSGDAFWMFGGNKTNYAESLFRLNAEELRIKDDVIEDGVVCIYQ